MWCVYWRYHAAILLGKNQFGITVHYGLSWASYAKLHSFAARGQTSCHEN